MDKKTKKWTRKIKNKNKNWYYTKLEDKGTKVNIMKNDNKMQREYKEKLFSYKPVFK